jgi:chromosome segregation ATPase
MLSMDIVGANRWESPNQELKSIREDVNSDVKAKFKGMEKVLGTLQHRVSKLEEKVGELSKSWAKVQNPRRV